MTGFSVYFAVIASKNLQKSSAIQNNSITLLSVIIAIIVCNFLKISTIKLQQFSLITKFTITYNSSNSRCLRVLYSFLQDDYILLLSSEDTKGKALQDFILKKRERISKTE